MIMEGKICLEILCKGKQILVLMNYKKIHQTEKSVEYLKDWKYWVPVRRVDNAFGDRNLICACPSVESYMQEAEV